MNKRPTDTTASRAAATRQGTRLQASCCVDAPIPYTLTAKGLQLLAAQSRTVTR